MLKKYVYTLLFFNIYNNFAYSMDFLDVVTDSTITAAISSSSPIWLTTALDARIDMIHTEFQKRYKKEYKAFEHARENSRQSSHCQVTLLGNAILNHKIKLNRIAQDYAVAQERFRNHEVPEYLRLAREVAKEQYTPKSELIAQGGVMVVASTLVSLVTVYDEISFSKLLLLMGCIYGGYQGGKKIIDGLEYDEYRARQKKARNEVIRLLQARQGNVFEQLAYKLKNA